MIAFDRHYRNSPLLKKLQPCNRMIHGLGINISPIEEVSGNQNKVNIICQRMINNYVMPCMKIVARPFVQIVAAAAKVNVCDVKKLHKVAPTCGLADPLQ